MADNRAALITAIQDVMRDAVGTDDDFLTAATELADAIRTYALALVPTGTAGGDPLVGGALT
jgi:hypothetical protein